ncbi:MAG: hemopexin repeat-containing protein [Rhodococcus sp. (in: high G+C Gram-positive bacteria)]|uniref:hemopexin repeat-containing protein n=1 Tax=Rhodococcus sp. TaxID=1831 RepID=UPI003BB4B37E
MTEKSLLQPSEALFMISKAYFVVGGNYFRYDATTDSVDPGYPRTIAANWTGFTAAGFDRGIDAALNVGNKVYFFRGSQYIRYDIATNKVDVGYPLPTGDHWPGLAAADFSSGIDAAVDCGNGTAFLFKGANYLRYDMTEDHADGQPTPIVDGWPGFGDAGFVDAIDSAVNWGNGKVYFFRGDTYLRYDLSADAADTGAMDIDQNWPGVARARSGSPIHAAWVKDQASVSVGLSDAFFAELKAICGRLRCAPADLLAVMESESGVRASAQNPNGKATGLIQFMPSTLVGLGWAEGPDAFQLLTAEQQLPYVEKYYKPHIGQLTSAGRLYQATFLPATLRGTNEDSVIAAPGGPHADAYNANKLLDTNHDGVITVSDLTARIDKVRRGQRWAALAQRP